MRVHESGLALRCVRWDWKTPEQTGLEATTLPLAQYVGVTIGIFLVSYAISMVETDLSVVLGFVGSTVGTSHLPQIDDCLCVSPLQSRTLH